VASVKVLILGGTKFLGLELLKKLFQRQGFEVHVASRRDPGNLIHFYKIDRKDQEDLSALFTQTEFDVIVDFISYSMPDAKKIIGAIRRRHDYNPYLITISSTYVYGHPHQITDDSTFDESDFNPSRFSYSEADRPEIDYYLGKKSMESYLVNNYDNYALIRFPVILGQNDYTGRTTYFLELIKESKKISFDKEFGASNYIFSNEAADGLINVMCKRITGIFNWCLNDCLDQHDVLSMYCDFFKIPLEHVLDDAAAKARSPFYYQKDFIINNNKQRQLFDFQITFEEALHRELKKIVY
jgi:nucleoside-diphosphate-sugar epimerase